MKKTNKKIKLFDNKGYLSKQIAIKRLEKYANEIDMVLTKYNRKSCNETMMIKGYRKSDQNSTNRKTHQEDLELIVGQIAKGLKLNVSIAKIMGKHHDIGHTFWGHNGEWWISSILEDYGLGYFCHSALGSEELIYGKNVYDEIINKIKAHNPGASNKELKRVKKNLWLIMDAINAHNGEKADKEYKPDDAKTESEFVNELKQCFEVKEFDKKIMPATPEACLMRLADKISYVPQDMVDGLKEGLVRDEKGNIVDYLDTDYQNILLELGITQKEIDEANSTKEFTGIQEKLKSIFINDVIKNSSKKKIKLSKNTLISMAKLLKHNNDIAVDFVLLKEDELTYPSAIRTLMNTYKDIIFEEDLLNKKPSREVIEKYKNTPYFSFITYIRNMKPQEKEFIEEIVEQATIQSIKSELNSAREIVQEGKVYEDEMELGLDYSSKNSRMRGYIKYYEFQLNQNALLGYSLEDLEKETRIVFKHLKEGNGKPNNLNLEDRTALLIGAKFLSTLNDIEFMELIKSTGIINEQQYASLTRKYKDIPNLHKDVFIPGAWKEKTSEQNQIIEK